jgi:uncharacterized protein with PQ loop repeat
LNFNVIKTRKIGIKWQADDKINFTFSWLLFFGLILYLAYGIAVKGLYWPVSEYDSLTGYDLMGKMIAQEGTLNVEIFRASRSNTYEIARFIYPPLTASSFGLGYVFGNEYASKLVMLSLFFGFLVSFYGLLRKTVQDTWAIAITFFVMITPEMFSHASLGLTNLPNAIYTSLSIICLIYWFNTIDRNYYFLSLLLLIFSVWSRSDSIVFIAGVGLAFVFQFIFKKEWKDGLVYLAIVCIPFVAWTLFIKFNVGANASDFFVKYLFWDAEKFSTVYGKAIDLMLGNGQLYGITFYVFIVLLALNIFEIVINKNYLIIITLSSWFLYTFLYYQMDYNFAGSMNAYLNASYKRGIFNFVPLVWFFIATNQRSLQFFKLVENWLYKSE